MSTSSSVLWLTPSVSSTYSCGRLAVTAVIVMRPSRMSSRTRSFVRKSSFSFPSAISYLPLRTAICGPILRVWARSFKLKLPPMSKAFVKDDAAAPETDAEPTPPPPSGKNYITPAGFARLQNEKKQLLEIERPEVVKTVAWAASLGDRSENADYIYGKRRLREIDRRVRFLIKRLESAQIVHASGRDTDQIDTARGHVSWLSPIARALIKARAGDSVVLRTPGGSEELEILEVSYP